jgi:hypothetical protein
MSRRLAAAMALTVAATACTISLGSGGPSSAPVPSVAVTPSSAPSGPGSAAAARAKLCDVPNQTPPPAGRPPEGTPPDVAEVERQVEDVRGLRYREPVAVQPLTASHMATQVARAFDGTVPKELDARRSLAWAAIGVIPPGNEIVADLRAFQTSQVVGFYVPQTGRLVYLGGDRLSPLSHVILAHELTHAIDDQHFDLDRLDRLTTTCADEAEEAAVGLVEGSAQFFSFAVARRFLTPAELAELGREAAASPTPDVPPFIAALEGWPYEAGLAFVSAIDASGGTAAVNAALRDLPVSTEQIMHPERYPNDVPVPVDVPDRSAALGRGWTTIDVSDAGEAFLDLMLKLRLDGSRADEAAAGWGGGIYRAWAKGGHVAVEMSTVWDSTLDARQFASAMSDWIGDGTGSARVLPVAGSRVRVLFGSDPGSLDLLDAAAA